MMNSDDPEFPRWIMALWPVVWPFLGGLGGAVVSLGLAKNQNISARKKAFTVLSGTIVAVFLGPLVVRLSLGASVRGDSQLVGAIYCLVGLSATSLMERFLHKLAKWVDRLPAPSVEESE